MSFSHDDVSNQVKDITSIANDLGGCMVALVTNKRVVVCCSGRNVANSVIANLKYNGYRGAEARVGLKTDRYYVQVGFNYPY